MNLDQARKEIFALMLRQEKSDDPNEIVAIQWLIDEKIKPLATIFSWTCQRSRFCSPGNTQSGSNKAGLRRSNNFPRRSS